MSIQWSEDYATGINEVDDQHKCLFDLLDNFEQRLRGGEDPTKMVDVLDGLAEYAAKHFTFEEGCMDRCRCTAASVNKLAHKRFIRMVDGMIQQFRRETPGREEFEALHREVLDWLKSHICKIDIRLRDNAVLSGK